MSQHPPDPSDEPCPNCGGMVIAYTTTGEAFCIGRSAMRAGQTSAPSCGAVLVREPRFLTRQRQPHTWAVVT